MLRAHVADQIPDVGKMTVGLELARFTGFPLFHNHVSIDAVLPVFGFGSPAFNRLVGRLGRPGGCAMNRRPIVRRSVLPASVLSLFAAVAVGAQEEASLEQGVRLRVTAPSFAPDRIIGVLLDRNPGAWVIEGDQGNRIEIPREAVTRVERSVGLRGQPGKGALVGIVLLGGVSAALPWSCDSGSCVRAPVVGFVLGAVPGFFLGGLIGELVKTDDWAAVPMTVPR